MAQEINSTVAKLLADIAILSNHLKIVMTNLMKFLAVLMISFLNSKEHS